MLTVENLAAGYGPAQVLFDVSFEVGAGEVVTLLGRNGMGKTTTIRTLMGLVAARGGAASFDGTRAARAAALSDRAARPRPRSGGPADLSDALTVEENLVATAAARFGAPRWTIARVYAFFPRLAERRRHMGNQLSGGEQQMLAIGRALMTNPEAAHPGRGDRRPGAADPHRDLGLPRAAQGGRPGHPAGRQASRRATRLADRHVVIEKGHVVWTGTSAALAADPSVRRRYLQV